MDGFMFRILGYERPWPKKTSERVVDGKSVSQMHRNKAPLGEPRHRFLTTEVKRLPPVWATDINCPSAKRL